MVFSQGTLKYLCKGCVLDSKDDRLALTCKVLAPYSNDVLDSIVNRKFFLMLSFRSSFHFD